MVGVINIMSLENKSESENPSKGFYRKLKTLRLEIVSCDLIETNCYTDFSQENCFSVEELKSLVSEKDDIKDIEEDILLLKENRRAIIIFCETDIKSGEINVVNLKKDNNHTKIVSSVNLYLKESEEVKFGRINCYDDKLTIEVYVKKDVITNLINDFNNSSKEKRSIYTIDVMVSGVSKNDRLFSEIFLEKNSSGIAYIDEIHKLTKYDSFSKTIKNVEDKIRLSINNCKNAVFRKLYKTICKEFIEYYLREAKSRFVNIDSEIIYNDFDEIKSLLEDLFCAINGEDVFDKLDTKHTCRSFILNPHKKVENKIDIYELNKIISKYLKLDWFNSQTFEEIVILAYVRYCFMVERKNLIDDINYNKPGFKNSLFMSWKFFVENIFPLIIIFIIFKINTIAGLILFLSFSGLKILSIYNGNKNKGILSKLADIESCVTSVAWSPNTLIEKFKSLEKDIHIPEIIPFVAKIRNRNPDIFVS
jgi:hypothetical protein